MSKGRGYRERARCCNIRTVSRISGSIAFEVKRDSRCRAVKAESTKALYTGMDEQARRQRPSLLDERLGLASFTEKNPFRSKPHQSSPSLAPPPGPISNKNFESKQFSSFSSFLPPSPAPSLNKSPFEAHKQRHCARSVSLTLALGESPRTSPSRRSLRKRAAIEAQRLTSAPRPSPCTGPALRYIFLYGNLMLTLNQAPGPFG